MGKDQGIDIRGVEMVLEQTPSELDALEDESTDSDTPAPQSSVFEERDWRIQCKRYKEIGPKLMREIVTETVPDGTQVPYGLIIAAACDVSADTMAAFREEATRLGVTEAHLWTKAHLEDLLFLPDNDHLLFAYFGISLQVRRRSQLREIRDRITLKRRIMKALNVSSVAEQFLADAVVRDADDTDFPRTDRVPGFQGMQCPPWHDIAVEQFHPEGLVVQRYGYDGWVKEDGTWDITDHRLGPPCGSMHQLYLDWDDKYAERDRLRWDVQSTFYESVPENERVYVRELWLLPYTSIFEIDPLGEAVADVPHLYCRFVGDVGPYGKGPYYSTSRNGVVVQLANDKRNRLFRNQ
ncbi:MAG: hypothetical protein ACYC4L_18300 [Chloroflexota bacterium]